MKRLLICLLPAMMLAACGIPPASAGSAPVGTNIQVDGKIMPAERGFAVIEAGYTAIANEVAALLDADKFTPADAARIRDINAKAKVALQAGHTAVSSVGIARAAMELLGLRDALRQFKGGG